MKIVSSSHDFTPRTSVTSKKRATRYTPKGFCKRPPPRSPLGGVLLEARRFPAWTLPKRGSRRGLSLLLSIPPTLLSLLKSLTEASTCPIHAFHTPNTTANAFQPTK